MPPDAPLAPKASTGWTLWPYVGRWRAQISYAVQTHAAHGKMITVQCEQAVSSAENVRMIVVSGWKDNQVAALP